MGPDQKLLEEYKEKMRQWVGEGDYEICHGEADKLLCELLVRLGYKEVVDIWKEVGKWYA